jgi:electron-transferring-flavoprotein dehydrogenase
MRGRPGVRFDVQQCLAHGASVQGALMERVGWPAIAFDGQPLVSHQDALLMGGKVQAPAGYADHVEICSGEAITASPEGQPQFDRENCIHCSAGGLHLTEN